MSDYDIECEDCMYEDECDYTKGDCQLNRDMMFGEDND